MNKYEALEFIENRLIDIDVEMMRDEEMSSDNPLLNEKWLLLEAQSRILGGSNPEEVFKKILEI